MGSIHLTSLLCYLFDFTGFILRFGDIIFCGLKSKLSFNIDGIGGCVPLQDAKQSRCKLPRKQETLKESILASMSGFKATFINDIVKMPAKLICQLR